MSVQSVPDESEWIAPLRLRLLRRDQLADLPQPDSLIADTLDRGTVGMLVGNFGTAKTFLGLDWAACVAMGVEWQERVTHPGTVLYIASEGGSGLDRRLNAWEAARGMKIDPESFHILPVPVQITEPQALQALCDLVHDLNPSLIVIDTLARCIVGLDENSARDMGRVVDALYRLRDAADDCTILVIHHTGKDKTTTRGSSALEAGIDTVYQMTGDADRLLLKRTKRKEGPTPDEHRLRLMQPQGQDSVVLEAVDSAHPDANRDPVLSKILSTLADGPMTTADVVKRTGLPRSTVNKKLEILERQGLIMNNSGRRTKEWELTSPAA